MIYSLSVTVLRFSQKNVNFSAIFCKNNVYHRRGGQFIQWPAFGGYVTEEWLTKNRTGETTAENSKPISCHRALHCDPPLKESPREEGRIRNDLSLEQSDKRAENALLKNKIAILERSSSWNWDLQEHPIGKWTETLRPNETSKLIN
ncbi:hypothetical protein B9Z55_027167 [Caenorhabditis nigoni]|uniref:Uncharacterized protein n=1 Tax=Caenorhabditis nigoni TaxID=1611254 RepID=A0A2G5SGL4_9PELO|nr:hypothetical protein B9Z55_027167 [Caenorhabditis nigoni]